MSTLTLWFLEWNNLWAHTFFSYCMKKKSQARVVLTLTSQSPPVILLLEQPVVGSIHNQISVSSTYQTAANWPCEEFIYSRFEVCVKLTGHPVSHCNKAVFNWGLRVGRIKNQRCVSVEACGGKGCKHTEHRTEWRLTQAGLCRHVQKRKGKLVALERDKHIM